MFETKKTLIVVYKDELLMNQLKKLVETKDDDSEQEIVGTRDNSINIVAWTEKVWLENKKAGNIQGKILFLGDIKGTDKLIPVIDVQFDDFGVRFGWAGNQAVLYADYKVLSERKAYDEFLKKLDELPIPDFLKGKSNMATEEKPGVMEDNADLTDEAVLEKDEEAEKSVSSDDGVAHVNENVSEDDTEAIVQEELFEETVSENDPEFEDEEGSLEKTAHNEIEETDSPAVEVEKRSESKHREPRFVKSAKKTLASGADALEKAGKIFGGHPTGFWRRNQCKVLCDS